MPEYALYLESGPRRRKTMVHVLDLLGCTASGPTTDAALQATPAAIRLYLRFLHAHGEPVDPHAPFTTRIAEHVTAGGWLANGDPPPGFTPDFQTLTSAELSTGLARLDGLHNDLVQLLLDLPPEALAAAPPASGRTIAAVRSVAAGRSMAAIVEHLAASQANYLRMAVGKVDGLTEAAHLVSADSPALAPALAQLWELVRQRLQAMTPDERSRLVPHGQLTWTARRGLRRMLEHGWEHLREINDRLDLLAG